MSFLFEFHDAVLREAELAALPKRLQVQAELSHAGHTFDRIVQMKKTSDLCVFTISDTL